MFTWSADWNRWEILRCELNGFSTENPLRSDRASRPTLTLDLWPWMLSALHRWIRESTLSEPLITWDLPTHRRVFVSTAVQMF